MFSFKNFIKFQFILCLVFGLLCGVSNAAEITKKSYDIYYKSHISYTKGNYDLAISQIKEAMKISPDNYDLTYKAGIYYISKPKPKPSNIKEAQYMTENDADIVNGINLFKEAIKLDPNRWEAYIAMARVYDGLDLTPVAVMWYDKGLSQPDIPADVKKIYTEYKNDAISRQNVKESKTNKTSKEPDLKLPLDMRKWYKSNFQGDDNYWMCEYGLKREDVKSYKWTKLFSVHFFSKEAYSDFTPDFVYEYMMSLAKQQASNINGKLNKKIISKDENNLYYRWSIKGFGEAEIARAYQTPKGIYLIRYTAKQQNFTDEEQENIVQLLKQVSYR